MKRIRATLIPGLPVLLGLFLLWTFGPKWYWQWRNGQKADAITLAVSWDGKDSFETLEELIERLEAKGLSTEIKLTKAMRETWNKGYQTNMTMGPCSAIEVIHTFAEVNGGLCFAEGNRLYIAPDDPAQLPLRYWVRWKWHELWLEFKWWEMKRQGSVWPGGVYGIRAFYPDPL